MLYFQRLSKWLTLLLCSLMMLRTAPSMAQNDTAHNAIVPGTVIDYSPAATRQYIGSPSLAILPNGTYIASHDIFGPGSTSDTTRIFESTDHGATWQHLSDIKGQFWSNLFTHHGALYIFGTSQEYGAAIIRRSVDGGRTWTLPDSPHTGLLLSGARYHTAPVPVVEQAGRIWRAFEDAEAGGGWGREFRSFVLSAPADADLLEASSWTASNRLHFAPDWIKSTVPGWLEGNIVPTPDGHLVNMLRVNDDRGDTAALVHIAPDGKTVTFDPAHDFIDFPGGRSKFTIRYDPVSQRYWSLVNKQRDPVAERNVLVLTSSPDLRAWRVEATIFQHSDPKNHAWQYIDWLFDGHDIIFVSRTAGAGSHNYHDANYFTCHRLANFRAPQTRQMQ